MEDPLRVIAAAAHACKYLFFDWINIVYIFLQFKNGLNDIIR